IPWRDSTRRRWWEQHVQADAPSCSALSGRDKCMSNRSSNHQIAIFEQRDLRASATGDELKQDRARTELKHCLGELKAIEGFPEGSDEAVLRHSLPPYYTACPNPFLRDAIPPEVENRPLHRLPRSEDV